MSHVASSEDARAPRVSEFDRPILDVAVIGGGSAGLGAALTLARARRAVLVIDGGQPRNAPAAGVHGFLTRDGISPSELLNVGRREVEGYGGRIVDGHAETARRIDGGFEVTLADGRRIVARRLLVTTGLVDELPEIPGVRERWGRDVLHCPYCHGWEVRDQAIGIVGTARWSLHQAGLFRQWSPDVALFTHVMPPLTDEQRGELTARGVRIVAGEVERLEIADDRLVGVRLRDGATVEREAVAVAPRFVARSRVLAELGLRPVELQMGFGEHIPAGLGGLTDVPGVWVAGNVTDLSAQVLGAAAAGVVAATHINADLVAEDTRIAVAAHRAAGATPSTGPFRRA